MSSFTLQLQFYRKQRNVDEDRAVFEHLTGYQVESWADNDPVQMVDVRRKAGESEIQTVQSLVCSLTGPKKFRGWLSFPDFATRCLYYTPCAEVEICKIEFCSMTSPYLLTPHYQLRADTGITATRRIYANFEHDIGRILLYICDESSRWNKILIHYEDISKNIVQEVTKDGTIKLVLSLKCSPSFWDSSLETVERKKRKLQRDYRGEQLEKKTRLKTEWSRLRTLSDDTAFDIPRCSTIVLTYKMDSNHLSRIVSGFKKHNFQCFFTKFRKHEEVVSRFEEGWIEELMNVNDEHKYDINLRYSLKCLQSVGYQFLDKLHKISLIHKCSIFTFLKREIGQCPPDRLEYVTETIYKLCQAFDKDPYLNPISVYKLYHVKVTPSSRCSLESHYQYIKRIIVTPSRMIFVPPEPIQINRILRRHIEYLDNFARVCFRDEDYSQFNVHSVTATDGVRRVIEYGVDISSNSSTVDVADDDPDKGDIVFKFLACSNSQLRSQGLWLFYPQCPLTIEGIRDSIGNLSKMKTVQKYVTRMGLAFTATDFRLSEHVEWEMLEEREMTLGNKKYTFSDGVGCISPAVQDLIIREKYGEYNTYRPVAFQVRIGGCKGMVAVNPDLGDRLVVQIRPSMRKFESEDMTIEPCGYSAPRELHMNRQVIAILRARGIPDNNFLVLQNRSLIELADMLTNERLACVEMGTKLKVKIADLKESRIRITTEPFLRSQLISLYKFKIRDAIAKTRFRIDHRKGRQMKGIMDETGTLNYGEIFVQYSSLEETKWYEKVVHTGDTFVTKNPCLHPGDLQRLTAVDVPELRHLYDVIVFPGKGQRPHPNELSGSDLDGDEYFVCWEEALLDIRPAEAAEYYVEQITPDSDTADVPPPQFTEKDINQFVFSYITKGSKLGQISNAHAIWADRLEKGVEDEKCKKLAHKHSDAVDFIKTGIEPKFDFGERSLIYPDWMQKPDKASYDSKTAIGKMFHVVQGLEHTITHLHNVLDDDIALSEIFLLDEAPTKEELESARTHYKQYCNELANMMVAYGILDEGDMAAGCLNTIKMSLAKEHERNYDMREQCLSMFRNLQRRYKKIFFSNVGVTKYNWKKEEEKVMRQAAAWYWVTYHKPTKHQDLILLSFPWCVANILIRIPELMNVCGTPNSIKTTLKLQYRKWYNLQTEPLLPLRDTESDLFGRLAATNVAKIEDLSRYTYGIIPANTCIFYIHNKFPKAFAVGAKHKLKLRKTNISTSDRKLMETMDNFQKTGENYATGEYEIDDHPKFKSIKIILTNDELLLQKVTILKRYCAWYDVIGPTLFSILTWAEENNLCEGRDVDIGLSFVEFLLSTQYDVHTLSGDEGDVQDVEISLLPYKNSPILYLDYLKWVIRCEFDSSTLHLDSTLLSTAYEILSTEKCLISAMREYHYVSYSLQFCSSDNFQELSILRKKEKKMCFPLACATSFCIRFFGKEENKAKFGDGKIDVRIRETELGGVNSLVLEIWGDNPQKMNDIADALQINAAEFTQYSNYLHVTAKDYIQKCYIAKPNTSTSSRFGNYFSLRKHVYKADKQPLKEQVQAVYTLNVKEAVSKALNTRLVAMRGNLYNPISHGNLTLTTKLGDLKITVYEHGRLEKGAIKTDKEIEDNVTRKLRGVTRRERKDEVTYIFNVLSEGINYQVVFDANLKPVSLSLKDIVWCDMMVKNDKGCDLNMLLTSTHTLHHGDLAYVLLTGDLFWEKGKPWFTVSDSLHKNVQLSPDLPCRVLSVEIRTETQWSFCKDPATRNITFSKTKIELYLGKHDKGASLRHHHTRWDLKIETELPDIYNTDLIKKYQDIALDLAMHEPNRTSYSGWKRYRTPSGRIVRKQDTADVSNLTEIVDETYPPANIIPNENYTPANVIPNENYTPANAIPNDMTDELNSTLTDTPPTPDTPPTHTSPAGLPRRPKPTLPGHTTLLDSNQLVPVLPDLRSEELDSVSGQSPLSGAFRQAPSDIYSLESETDIPQIYDLRPNASDSVYWDSNKNHCHGNIPPAQDNYNRPRPPPFDRYYYGTTIDNNTTNTTVPDNNIANIMVTHNNDLVTMVTHNNDLVTMVTDNNRDLEAGAPDSEGFAVLPDLPVPHFGTDYPAASSNSSPKDGV